MLMQACLGKLEVVGRYVVEGMVAGAYRVTIFRSLSCSL